MNKTDNSMAEPFIDEEGFHIFGEGEKPDENQLEEMEQKYQSQIRNSPIWEGMVEEYGLEKAEEMLKEFKVKIK